MKRIKLILAALLSLTAWTGAMAQTEAIDFDAEGNYHLFKTAEGASYPETDLQNINTDTPWGFYRYKVSDGTYTKFTTYDTGGSNGTATERGIAWYTEKEYCFVSSTGHYHSTTSYSPAIVFTAPADGIYFATMTVWRDKANKSNTLYLRSRVLDKGETMQCDKGTYIFDKAYGTVAIDNDNGQVPQTLDFYIKMEAGQRFTFETESYTAGSNYDGRTHISDLAVASCSSKGTPLTLEAAEVYSRFYDTSNIVDITYVVKDANGNTLETNVVPTEKGTQITALPTNLQRPFTQYSEVDVTVSKATTIEFTATWDEKNAPFELSDPDDLDNAKWYNMTIRSNYSVFMDSAEPYTPKKDATAADKMADEYQWAFAGDAYGIVLYNKAKGAGWTLTKDEQNTVMREGTYSWTLGKNSDGFTLRETSSDINVINHRSQVTLGLWQDGSLTSDGSTFRVSEVPADYSKFVVDEITPWVEGTYFVLKPTAIGYQESYKTACTQAQYESMKAAVDAKKADLANFVLPETGYYRISNKRESGSYLQYGEKDGTPIIATSKSPAEAIGNVVKLSQLEDYKYTIAVGGRYASAPEQNVVNQLATTETEFQVIISKPGYVVFTTGDNYNALHCASSGNCVGWSNTSDGSQWIVEDATIPASVDVTIGAAGYATLNALWPVAIPDGVTAYTGTITTPEGKDYSYLTLNKIEGSTIPATTPVVLAGDPATYTFAFADDVEAIEANDLKGTYQEVAAAGQYVLAQPDGEAAGFYKAASGNIAAYKAYITLPAAGEVKGLSIVFNDATGISETVNANALTGKWYNVAGQRVRKAQKGIYIVNGKKVVK